jgi:Ca2+-binding RTX toxin-like protein
MAACAAFAAALVAGGPQPGTALAQSTVSHLAFDTEDIDFILDQIKFAERHAAGEELRDILPNLTIPWGLRTVDGSFNNLIPGQEGFGAADLEIPSLTERVFPDAQAGTSYNSAAPVTDSTPRLISHLIVNQSVANPAAVATANAEEGENIGPDLAGEDQFFIANTAPDEGLSAPVNAFMTFFGQFFDHGLGLINKGGHGFVTIPLQADDPLFDPGPDGNPATVGDNGPNVMMMPRATRSAGPDGIVGTEDDGFVNATTPHVDQQQTYASHASAQILLRHYRFEPCIAPVPATPPGPGGTCLQNTGHLLNGYGNDRALDTADDGGLTTWDTAQAQGLLKMGIDLDDLDGNNIPMILADPYGNFIPGPARGLPQLVTAIAPDGTPTLVEGNLAAPVDASIALRVNHSFFLDVAHTAAPNGTPDVDTAGVDLEPGIPGIQALNPRTDDLSGQVTRGIRASAPAGSYDDELLGMHFVCGDGRCNENIALSTIHAIFHSEHNRLVDVAKRIILDSGDLARLNQWLDTPVAAFPAWGGLAFPVSDASLANQAAAHAAIEALGLDWNGARVFQAARFGTEMQYNRIVFDEFSPILAGLKDVFEGFHTDVDPQLTQEFSASVYRFGHSMLTQTVDRFDSDFNPIDTPTVIGGVAQSNTAQLGLFEAFLNPLALYNTGDDGIAQMTPHEAEGAVVRGITRTAANEIDEFVTGALQNNLVGLPLDLGAINIARGRDVGNPPLNVARRQFFEVTQDTRLKHYLHWMDYADNMRHEASLVNFIAAYGTHPTLAGPDGIVGNADDPNTTFAARRAAACAIVGGLTDDPAAYCEANGFGAPPATPADARDFLFSQGAWASDADGHIVTGLDNVDFWNGGLAEERMPFGGYLGSTHNYIFETQMESLQNGDRFYYVGRTADIHLFSELESNTFTSLAMRNTDLGEPGAGAMPLNIFSVPNHILEVDQSQQFDAAGDGTAADPEGESELIPLVIRDPSSLTTNIEVADTTRIVQYTGGDHVTIGGTPGDDTIIGGIGDDSIFGGAGNDRIEGGDGADHIVGGPGDDIITDLSGPDVIEGGDGNDAIMSGNEEDVIFGDAGNDFIVNPSELGEIFGGLGNDFIHDGIHLGHIRGGGGDDWMENLGGGEDLFQGDDGAAPESGEPPVKGNDVMVVYGGNTDSDMESGDDIVVDGPGIDRVEGQLGFDWVSFQNDRFGVDVDLDLTIFNRPTIPPSNDTINNRYDRVEGISGSSFADILRGTGMIAGDFDGNELTQANMALIEGLGDGAFPMVPLVERRILPNDILTGEAQFGWSGGEIILGGGGSDLLVGENGDDIIDGDAILRVAIRTPDPAIRSGPLGQALRGARTAANSAASQAELDAQAVLAFTDAKSAAEAAVLAAQAATAEANAAVAAQEAAQAGLSTLTVTDAIGNLITAAVIDGSIKSSWQAFLDACSAALGDLGIDVTSTAADRAAQALAAQLAAEAENLGLTVTSLQATAAASAAAVAPAQAALADAQAALDAADAFILVKGMRDIQDAVFKGFINPGELSISRVISDDDPAADATDSALFRGNLADYTIVDNTATTGFFEVTDNRVPGGGGGGNGGRNVLDGRDLVRNVERLVFADQTVVLDTVAPINSVAVGAPTISGDTPPLFEVGETLTASIAGITDADNVTAENPAGDITGPVLWTWQVELDPGTGIFEPIERLLGGGDPFEVNTPTLDLTAAESGLLVRVSAFFQDDEGVFEVATSAPVQIEVAVNTAPVASNDTATTFEDTPVDIDVLANDTDADGDGLAVAAVGAAANGTVVNNAASVTYTPNAGFIGADSFAYTAIDANGAASGPATVTVTVTAAPVIDATPPVVIPPADVTAEATGIVTAVALGTATATDDVDGPLTPTPFPAGPFLVGDTTVIWSATDAAGNTGAASQLVTVTDNTPPVVTAPADVTVTDGEPVVLGAATAVDLVDGAVTPVTNDAPATFPVGATIVTWSATDAAGNTGTDTQTVTVNPAGPGDNTPPVITVPADITQGTDPGLATAVVVFTTPTAVDDVDGSVAVTQTAGLASGSAFPVGATTQTWTASDTAGNTATASFTVTVVDDEAPVVTAPADVSAEATGPQTIVAIGAATATDNVGVASLVSDAPASFPVGSTTVTWTATDAAGNAGTATQTVTVADNTPPAVTAPADVTVTDGDPIVLGTATAVDLVDGAVAVTNDAPATFPLGATTVTWSATDNAGNTGTDTQLVTVNPVGADITPPVVTAPADITAEATGPTTAVALGTATAIDDVDGALTATPDNTGPFPVGITIVTWTATDAAGNVGTDTQSVTVNDTTPPAVTAPADVTVDEGEPVILGTATATDAVGVVSLVNDAPATFPVGATTVTWTATDAAGNTGTDTQLVTVNAVAPNVAPTVSLAPLNPRGVSPFTVPFVATAADTDGTIVSIEWDFGDGGTATGASATYVYTGAGNFTATVTVTDDDGATATASTLVRVR